jgi:transposase
MDNCAIHHDEEVRALVEGECGKSRSSHHFRKLTQDAIMAGAKLIYLPPYSPDFNPIEQAFHSLKAWLRRHEADAIDPQTRPWLIQQASLSITIEDAEGWIINSGYSFDMM